PADARMALTPFTSPTAGLDGVLATLVTRIAPEPVSTETMSVKVPPVSMPMRKRAAVAADVIAFSMAGKKAAGQKPLCMPPIAISLTQRRAAGDPDQRKHRHEHHREQGDERRGRVDVIGPPDVAVMAGDLDRAARQRLDQSRQHDGAIHQRG